MARKKGRRSQELTAVSYVMIDGEAYEFDSLSEEQKEIFRERIYARLSRTVSDYFSNHLDELAKAYEKGLVTPIDD